jgi:hypothetical protein
MFNPILPPVFLNMSQAVLSARLLARARYKAERQTEAETAGAGDFQRVGWRGWTSHMVSLWF